MWYFTHLRAVYIYCIQQFQVRTQVCAAEPASTEKLSANKNLEENLRNLQPEACCARQITSLTLIAKTNQENSPHKPACNDKRITGLQNVPTGKTGRSCHPSKRERHAGMPPSDTQQGKEEQKEGEQGMHGGTIRQCTRRSLQQHWYSAWTLEVLKKRR